MRQLFLLALGCLSLLALAGFAAAAESGALAGSEALSSGYLSGAISASYLGAALGLGIAACGCGIGMGLGLKGCLEGTARNPEAGGKLMVTLILGLAIIESLAIYALVISLVLLFVNPLAAPFAG
ncbi:MAG: ATP synthase F0 subunit C [Deltaproteobacteria bacterium]|jgi:F-type H+-transporting ATPase subunit c|nr:ATP synthase F0 subunit C [Deltaproteobacteria bacterium]